MAEEKNTCDDEIVLDSETASTLVKDPRKTFLSGKTKSYEWRVEQLKSILKMIDENEQAILDSLRIDLSKPQLEAFVSEISLTKSACSVALHEFKKWMKPEKVGTSLTIFPFRTTE